MHNPTDAQRREYFQDILLNQTKRPPPSKQQTGKIFHNRLGQNGVFFNDKWYYWVSSVFANLCTFCDGVLEFQNMNSAKRLAFKRGFILVCCVYESSVTMLVDELIYLVWKENYFSESAVF